MMGPAIVRAFTLSLHDALPICRIQHLAPAVSVERDRRIVVGERGGDEDMLVACPSRAMLGHGEVGLERNRRPDRKSTRLNSSHLGISYAVFCLKKKITKNNIIE